MKRKAISTFKVLPFFLLVLLILGSLLISGCSPLDLVFGPSGSIYVSTYPSGANRYRLLILPNQNIQTLNVAGS